VLDPLSGVVLAAATLVSIALVRVLVPWSVRRSGERSARWRGELAADVSQGVLASPDLVAYGASGLVRDSAHRSIERLAGAQRRTAVLAGLGEAIVLTSTGCAVAVIAALSGGLDPVLVGVVVLAPLALLEPLSALAEAEALRPGIDDAQRRLAELSEMPAAIADPVAPAVAPQSFAVEVEGLEIGWDSTMASGIDFAVPEGGTIAIAGPSGVGKSTLALTVARLIEPRGGVVRLGGTNVCELASADVRSVIGYLAQDEIVFDTTIRENLRIAHPSATDAEMLAALRTAGMADFMASLPDGLDTTVGERGGRLSGGEKQRLCLARLVLGGHRVLVLDEPTEHLDRETAETLLDDILALAPTRSIIVISHAPWVLDRLGRTVDLDRRAA
jgi:ABC-type transport system involved in cytochrome bd biosynthesis fused ATPase/permease subunit